MNLSRPISTRASAALAVTAGLLLALGVVRAQSGNGVRKAHPVLAHDLRPENRAQLEASVREILGIPEDELLALVPAQRPFSKRWPFSRKITSHEEKNFPPRSHARLARCGRRAHLRRIAEAAEPPEQTAKTEVVVYGGTPAGIMAAIAAARQGHTVALIDLNMSAES
ncbi:MAG: FAD-dependent oxidoreductase [Verrucomicrobiota bacterium]|nr:FAD-dependent oxidoreductase [Verrucomicrobiota bacterium]